MFFHPFNSLWRNLATPVSHGSVWPPRRALLTAVFVMAAVTCSLARGEPVAQAGRAADAGGLDFFEKKVRPVLAQQCYKCHSHTSDKLKGGLYLDSREGMLKGGETGPAVVPGHPEKSLLIEAVRYGNQDLQMPPKTRLPGSVVADLVTWVQMGAPCPGGTPQVTAAATTQPAGPPVLRNLAGVAYDALRHDHWAWQPVKATAAPPVKNAAWARSDIDRFLLAPIEAKGLHPVGDADRATLIRRASFDLTGLPPTPAQTQAFVSDPSPDAFAKVVDRLLASPAFGERWGRHWLDVARYAESTGSSRNVPYSYAWRYRDYVIDAFNKDKPYDRFVAEQVAGDLLPYTNPAEHNEHVIATGFLAIGVKDLNEKDRLKYEMDNVDEQIDTLSRSVLGLTVSCARCHDHKFDPIPTADYYSLAGIFRSTQILSGLHGRRGGNGKDYEAPDLLARLDKVSGPGSAPTPQASLASVSKPAGAAGGAPGSARVEELTRRLEEAKAELRNLRAKAIKNVAGENGGGKAALRPRLQEKRQEVARLVEQLDALGSSAGAAAAPSPGVAPPPTAGDAAVGVRDVNSPRDSEICIRGDSDNLGAAVPRGFPGVIRLSAIKIDSQHSGRLELAQWVTSPDNPMTARVAVNRIWQHLFGQGLVRTVDNFGTTGEAPSHPELLDYLAGRFVRDGWSVKRTIRSIMLSRAYQLAGTYDPADAAVDPGDRLVWRMSPRRLEAEAIRDAMLAAGGRLDSSRPAGSPVMGLPVAELRKLGAGRLGEGGGDADTHRSVYLPILRSLLPPVLDVFDFAEPTMVTGNRDVTTVATQALFLMNNPFVLDQSHRLANRVLAAPNVNDAGRVDLAYQLALSRSATPAEQARALQYVSAYAAAPRDGAVGGSAKGGGQPKSEAWASLCQALFCSAEFRYVN